MLHCHFDWNALVSYLLSLLVTPSLALPLDVAKNITILLGVYGFLTLIPCLFSLLVTLLNIEALNWLVGKWAKANYYEKMKCLWNFVCNLTSSLHWSPVWSAIQLFFWPAQLLFLLGKGIFQRCLQLVVSILSNLIVLHMTQQVILMYFFTFYYDGLCFVKSV